MPLRLPMGPARFEKNYTNSLPQDLPS
jgi:hypothetical protein